MTDHNNLARAYSSDVSENDPLAELARIVSGQEAPARKTAPGTFASQYNRTATPAPAAAPRAVEAPSFDLEDALMAELGFEENTPAPPPAPAARVEAAQAAVAAPQAEPARQAPAASLEDQLLAELSFEDIAPAKPADAAPVRRAAAAPEPEAVVEVARIEHADAGEQRHDEFSEFDEFAGIFDQPQSAQAEPVEGFNFDQAFEEALAESVPAKPAMADLDALDFGSAFEAELREMETVAPAPAAAPVKSMAQRREPASERVLEDQFAAAFAEELDLGVSRALEGRKPAAAVVTRPRQSEDAMQAAYRDIPENWEQEFPLDPADDADDYPQGRIVPPARRFGRGMQIAAGALAVAVIVGGGALAMSFMGEGGPVASKDPVIVKADTDPVKVKPENPGGVEIQNQNQDVYKQVAGASPDGGNQDKLVSTSEEPLEIARVAEETTPPADGTAIAPETGEEAASSGDVAPATDAKADARLAPAAEEVSAKPAALAPRRVKTLLIKPDGTVVSAPAEEVAASVNAPAGSLTSLAESSTSPAAAAADTVAASAATTAPKEVETVASTKAAPAAAQPAEQPAQVASAEPAAAPAPVGSGEWAVQLASQRSAEDAQATFQNLKQKFPGVLDGKPMAIQKAEVAGKGIFYRVRVPTQTKDEAVLLCEDLKAAGGSCFVSR